MYYYSLSRSLTHLSFLHVKHVLFYNWTTFRHRIRERPQGSCDCLVYDSNLVNA
jgi:hypothetical protein